MPTFKPPSVGNDTFSQFLRAAQSEDGRLGIGNWIQLQDVANAANMKVDIARLCLARLVEDGLSRQVDADKFLINRDGVRHALTEMINTDSSHVDEANDESTRPVNEEEQALLRDLFNCNEKSEGRLISHRFRMKHKGKLPIIDRLLQHRLIAAEREFYRLTLDGLHAANDPAVREYIASFNNVLPVLCKIYEEEGSKPWSVDEVIKRVRQSSDNRMVNEDVLKRAFWYIVPDLEATTGITPGASGELASFNLHESIVTMKPLPLSKDVLLVLKKHVAHAPFLDHSQTPASASQRESEQPELVEALRSISEPLAACYRQAVRDINQSDRESFVGPAASLRELVTAVLHERAPDSELTTQPGFKGEGEHGRPSRAQRVRYILGGRARRISPELIDRALDGLDSIVVDIYKRASDATHLVANKPIHLGAAGRQEITTLAHYVHGILRDLLL